MSAYAEAWLTAFEWTLAIEMPLVVWLLRPVGLLWWHTAVLSAVVNALTHPTLWLAYRATYPDLDPRWLEPLIGDPYLRWILVGESAVWFVEAVAFVTWLRLRVGPGHVPLAILAAVVANLASTLFGLSGVTHP